METGTWTTYAYNANDTVQSVTDARNATATYTYNARRLVTNITYSAPSNVAPTPPVSLFYDAAGNRTQMIDGSGSKIYQYDSLSRMSAETQTINGVAGSFAISYTYNLAGSLQSLTDPVGHAITYGYDRIGRISNVSGSGFVNASLLADNFQYRAWGDKKHYNTHTNYNGYHTVEYASMAYNTSLQLSHYESGAGVEHSGPPTGSNYSYYADGNLEFAQDNNPPLFSDVAPHAYDRAYRYDPQGRLSEALTGTEARGGTVADGPYREAYSHDAFGQMTSRDARLWSNGWDGFAYNYVNGRNQSWQYDPAGNITNSDGGEFQL
jgi:YD repeat-containing protein